MKQILNVVMAGFAVSLIAACSSSQKHQAGPAPTPQQQAASQMSNERTTYVNQTQSRIDQLSKFSSDLHTRAASAQKPNDKKMMNAAEDLDSLITDASLTEVKTAAPENWIDYKRDVEKSMDRAESQYSNSLSLVR
jgi:hypothetical protein